MLALYLLHSKLLQYNLWPYVSVPYLSCIPRRNAAPERNQPQGQWVAMGWSKRSPVGIGLTQPYPEDDLRFDFAVEVTTSKQPEIEIASRGITATETTLSPL